MSSVINYCWILSGTSIGLLYALYTSTWISNEEYSICTMHTERSIERDEEDPWRHERHAVCWHGTRVDLISKRRQWMQGLHLMKLELLTTVLWNRRSSSKCFVAQSFHFEKLNLGYITLMLWCGVLKCLSNKLLLSRWVPVWAVLVLESVGCFQFHEADEDDAPNTSFENKRHYYQLDLNLKLAYS